METSYAQQSDDPTFNANRRTKLFFGLCDMRTAVVALNILNVIFTIIVAIVLSTMYALDQGPYRTSAITGVFLGAVVVIGLSCLGLYSAMNWRLDGMYATTLGFLAVLIFRIVHVDIIDIIVTALLFYPHVVLTADMKTGTMSPETFDQEEFVTESGRDFVEMANGYIGSASSYAGSIASPRSIAGSWASPRAGGDVTV